MNSVKFKPPLFLKGQILPASLIEKSYHREKFCCKQIRKCLENQLQTCNQKRGILSDCFKINKLQKKKLENMEMTPIKKLKSHHSFNQKINQHIFDFQDELHSCATCLETAIDRDINNKIISNRNRCYLNKLHYFYVNDIYLNKKNTHESVKLSKNNYNTSSFKNGNITFALLFGDNSNFYFQSSNETGIYSHYSTTRKDSNYNPNVLVTSL